MLYMSLPSFLSNLHVRCCKLSSLHLWHTCMHIQTEPDILKENLFLIRGTSKMTLWSCSSILWPGFRGAHQSILESSISHVYEHSGTWKAHA